MKFDRKTLFIVAGWAFGIAALIAAVQFALTQAAERLIKSSAEHTAVRYAHNISAQLPELPRLFAEQSLGRETLADLKRLRSLGDVFRFKLFDPRGALLMVSDDLDLADPLANARASGQRLGSHHSANEKVAEIVLGGANFIDLQDGAGKPGRPPLYTEAYVPLIVEGAVLGVIEVYVDSTPQATRIRAAFAEVALIVAGALLLVGGALGVQWMQRRRDRQRAETRVRYLAKHDVLSGALNRASFNEALEQAAWRHEQGGPDFAVMCIDLDRFKEVNDAHGHAGGDAVLREATHRLQSLVRHGDLLARLGGDEFAILQSDVAHSDDLHSLGQRIVDALAAPYTVGGQRVVCGSSVGAARFGVDAKNVEDLLHKADVAMYRAKSSGRGRFSFYDHELDRQLEERRELARELREALVTGAMAMHYQALYAADGQTLLGYEALMRWKHATRGMVPPSTFIPLAEDTGQIEALGQWALERSCAEAVAWPMPLTVSVNLSAAQFRGEHDLVDVVSRALDKSGLPADRLVLEITESLLMSDTEAVVNTLTRLSALGVSIAMDDFGTGYSSLAYLWRFPFDKVKIDRAFTQGLGDDKKVALIVRSIVSLAHSLGIRVNAEGVETEPQAHMLRKMGCDELQGFLLGRPVPANTLMHDGIAHRQPDVPKPSATDFAALETRPMAL
ncbi:MAG: putative bifunctional diguanylate cyclase/phosphodiesterase [Rubrivivax sp.]|jgi:diguanylate cyclase (GGDEF)-like protein|nr:EAL domain-containing protein [Rubrivivax sp.]